MFLLSESEVYATADAKSYGFAKDHSIPDESRMSKSSAYAKAMRLNSEKDSKYAGNCLWWLRSPGDLTNIAAYVDYKGYGNSYGDDVDASDRAVRPALHLDISASNLWNYAGTVCSDGTVREVRIE